MSIITTSLLRIQLDQRIDPHNRNTCLHRTLQLPHLAHTRLQHPALDLIHHLPPRQIQSIVLVVSTLGDGVGLFLLVAVVCGFFGGGGAAEGGVEGGGGAVAPHVEALHLGGDEANGALMSCK